MGTAILASAAGPIEITERPAGHPGSHRMLGAFHAEQVARYGFADPVDLIPGEYAPPRGVFAVVYRDARSLGCGGYRWFDRAAVTHPS